MAKNTDHLAGSFDTENTGGVLSGFLAEEDEFDRRALWRLGSWGVASVGAVVVAVMANQSSLGWRRDQMAAADLAQQAQPLQAVAKESQNEARRLASAVDTLNGDRDRLYSRVTVLEQGLDSVTGAIAKQNPRAGRSRRFPTADPAPAQNASPAPVAGPVATTQAAPHRKSRAASTPVEPAPPRESSRRHLAKTRRQQAAATPQRRKSKSIRRKHVGAISRSRRYRRLVGVGADPTEACRAGRAPRYRCRRIQRTEFGVDVGGANSVAGLRALWRGLLKSRANAPLAALHPIIVIKEGTGGLGMQLRLVAGPLRDAAAAAKICAVMSENDRACETAIFDGQRLSMDATSSPAAARPTGFAQARRCETDRN